MVGVVAETWRDTPGAAHPGAARAADGAVGRGRGGPARGPAAATEARRRAARTGGVDAEALLRAARSSSCSGLELELLGEEGLRVLRLDDGPARAAWTSSAATRATATCVPRATRSRAGRRRSSATSSPSAYSACPRAARGHERPVEGPAAMSEAQPARHRRRGPTCARAVRGAAGRPLLDASSAIRLYDGDRDGVAGLWPATRHDLGLAGLHGPARLGGAGGVGPRGRCRPARSSAVPSHRSRS